MSKQMKVFTKETAELLETLIERFRKEDVTLFNELWKFRNFIKEADIHNEELINEELIIEELMVEE